MLYIRTSKGLAVKVDDEMYPFLNRHKWHKCGKYVATVFPVARQTRRCIPMHRLLLPLRVDVIVDHINGDALDNRVINLRPATYSENSCHQGPNRRNTTGFKGVRQVGNRFKTLIKKHGKSHYLGMFATAEEAARAYDAAARKLHGQFAELNFHGDQSSSLSLQPPETVGH